MNILRQCTILFMIAFLLSLSASAVELKMFVGKPPAGTCDDYIVLPRKDNYYLANRIFGFSDKHISLNTSIIEIYESKVGILQECRNAEKWSRQSEVVPDPKTVVVTFGANCELNKSSEFDNSEVYIKFREQLGDITRNGSSKIEKHYSTYENGAWSVRKKSYENYMVGNYEFIRDTKKCLVLRK